MYPLSNVQIDSILKHHYHTTHYYGGCYAKDTLPARIVKYPSFLICNTSSSNHLGEHWVYLGFSARNQPSEYFDSLGESLDSLDPVFRNVLLSNGSGSYTANTRPYQGEGSVACGHFVLYVADRRSQNIPYSSCLLPLRPYDFDNNETYVINHVTNHMRKTRL